MSKNKKDRLLLNLLEGEKHRHRVAMVNEEGAFNQHEPNSNMARMFVVMLLIHVVVIGGIIIYDWVSGEDAPQSHAATASLEHQASPASALPPPAVDAATLDRELPIEEFATYEWKSGDSIPSVAKKLNVSEDVLIKLNMLDRGTQLDQHSILRYPKRPLVKAVGIGVAGANGELPQPPPPSEGITGAHASINLKAKEQTFAFSPDISNELTPAPTIVPGQKIEDSPPAATTHEATGTPVVKKDTPKIAEAPPAAAKTEPRQAEKSVPKAIPVTRQTMEEKVPAKKVVDSPPATKKAATAPAPVAKTTTRGRSHIVKPGETLYSIATKNGISVKSLQAANKVVKPEALRDGMTLTIPAK